MWLLKFSMIKLRNFLQYTHEQNISCIDKVCIMCLFKCSGKTSFIGQPPVVHIRIMNFWNWDTFVETINQNKGDLQNVTIWSVSINFSIHRWLNWVSSFSVQELASDSVVERCQVFLGRPLLWLSCGLYTRALSCGRLL